MSHLPELTLVQVRALRAIAAAGANVTFNEPITTRTLRALVEKFCISVPKGLSLINEAMLTPTGRQVLDYYERRDRRRSQKAKSQAVGAA